MLILLAASVISLASCGEGNCVDLGLPSGTKWAAVNIGGSSPLDPGDYLSWGGLDPQECYRDEFDRFCTGRNVFTKYNPTDGLMRLQEEDDVATIRLGRGWHTPSTSDFEELFENCIFEFVEVDEGMNHFKLTGKNGNSIVIPAGGNCFSFFKPDTGSFAELWTVDMRDSCCGLGVCLNNHGPKLEWGAVRYMGRNVRPVFRKPSALANRHRDGPR